MKGENDNSADKEKKSLLSTVDLPGVDKTEDKAGNEENDQDATQTEIPDPIEETKIQGENQDKETIAGGPDKTTGTEEVKAHQEKEVLPNTAELPGDEDEGIKTEDQEEVAAVEEQNADEEKETTLNTAMLPEDKDQEVKIEAQEEIPEVEDETDIEGNDEGEEGKKGVEELGLS